MKRNINTNLNNNNDKQAENTNWKERFWSVLDLISPALFWVSMGLFSIVALFSIFFGMDRIDGHSMDPNFTNQEQTIFTRNTSNLKKGDVVLVKINDAQASLNHKKAENIIKRVVATENDTVEIRNSVVYVNNKAESFKNYKVIHYTEPVNMNAFKLGKGELFILGDNRPISFDSHYFGPITTSQVWGKFLTHFNAIYIQLITFVVVAVVVLWVLILLRQYIK